MNNYNNSERGAVGGGQPQNPRDSLLISDPSNSDGAGVLANGDRIAENLDFERKLLEKELQRVCKAHEAVRNTYQSELETRRAVNDRLEAELLKAHTSQEAITKALVKYQGLLCQFTESNVRNKFRNGLFYVEPCCQKTLDSIDILRKILLPAPTWDESEDDYYRKFLTNFLISNDDEPLDRKGNLFLTGKLMPIGATFLSG